MTESPRTAPYQIPPYRLLDAWRGVAALGVVLLHCSGDDQSQWFYQPALLGLLCVPMFFVISGYCIAHAAMRSLDKPRPVAQFAWARVRRIYPPYFFASLATIVLATLLALLAGHHSLNFLHHSPRYYFGALTLTQPLLGVDSILPVFWSLSYEAAFYGIVAAALLTTRARYALPLLDCLGVVTLSTLLWMALAAPTCPFPWNRWPQFGMGVLVYQLLTQPGRTAPRAALCLGAVLLVVWAVRFSDSLSLRSVAALELGSNLSQSLFCLPFALLLVALFGRDASLAQSRLVRLLSWVGLFSYSLYLSHYIALRVVVQLALRLALLGAHPLLLFGIKVAACLGGGLLFFRLCERPFLDTRQRQLARTQRDAPTP